MIPTRTYKVLVIEDVIQSEREREREKSEFVFQGGNNRKRKSKAYTWMVQMFWWNEGKQDLHRSRWDITQVTLSYDNICKVINKKSKATMQIWVTIRSWKKIHRKSKVLQIYDDQTVYYTAPKV